jgi:heterodisulfide reductase subunit A-like polyferredoxin
MYAIKDAMIAKEHSSGELDCAIFNMDVRTLGKEYETYYRRAGVRQHAGITLSQKESEVNTGG